MPLETVNINTHLPNCASHIDKYFLFSYSVMLTYYFHLIAPNALLASRLFDVAEVLYRFIDIALVLSQRHGILYTQVLTAFFQSEEDSPKNNETKVNIYSPPPTV